MKFDQVIRRMAESVEAYWRHGLTWRLRWHERWKKLGIEFFGDGGSS